MPIPGSRFQKFVPGIVKFFFKLYIFVNILYIKIKKIVYNNKNKKIKK